MKKGIEHLRHIVYKKAKQKHQHLTLKIVERLEYELEVIEKDNKQLYFLSIMEVFKLMKERGIYTGSYFVLSSLVAYYMSLSPLNPMKYNLLFERILNSNYSSIEAFKINTNKEGLQLVDYWLVENEKKLNKTKNLLTLIKSSFILDKRFELLNRAARLIHEKHNEVFQIDQIPLSDYKTMKLFQKGNTEGVPDFSSFEICKYLVKIKPESIQDLAVIFAMYRPGLMEFIPNFINRKMKQKKFTYPHSLMKKHLKETLGIIVYQEQLLLLSQRLAGFNIQESNSMRMALIEKKSRCFKEKFEVGCKSNDMFIMACENEMKDVDVTILKIWNDLNNYSKYGFLKSYAIHKSIIAFQIAFIKAHYNNEFEEVLKLK